MLCSLEDLLCDSVTPVCEHTILCLNFQEKVAKKVFNELDLEKKIVWNFNRLHLQYVDFGICTGRHLKTSASERINVLGYLYFSLYSSSISWRYNLVSFIVTQFSHIVSHDSFLTDSFRKNTSPISSSFHHFQYFLHILCDHCTMQHQIVNSIMWNCSDDI